MYSVSFERHDHNFSSYDDDFIWVWAEKDSTAFQCFAANRLIEERPEQSGTRDEEQVSPSAQVNVGPISNDEDWQVEEERREELEDKSDDENHHFSFGFSKLSQMSPLDVVPVQN
jgi:hypothetical protein